MGAAVCHHVHSPTTIRAPKILEVLGLSYDI